MSQLPVLYPLEEGGPGRLTEVYAMDAKDFAAFKEQTQKRHLASPSQILHGKDTKDETTVGVIITSNPNSTDKPLQGS
jgi:hypothetical protein